MAQAATAKTITEKRANAASIPDPSAIYTRVVSFTTVAGDDSGTANLTGLTIPKDTLVLGGSISTSASQGSGALKFSLTTDGDICGATTPGTTVDVQKALASPVQVCTTADRVVTYTPSVALAAATLTLTLILCAVGPVSGRSASVGN